MTRPRRILAALCLAVGAALLPLAPVPARADAGYAGESVPALILEASQDYGVDYGFMLHLARCESGLRPWAVNPVSGAAGLYQFMPRTFAWASAQAGYAGASRFDPEASAQSAAWLLAQPGGARHWVSCL